jgi:hypothetical protein
MNTIKNKTTNLKARRVFIKSGTCSQTFFHILNREYGHPKPNEELAVDPLAGGILQQGYQCGMLWGAAMAVGAEAYRRYPDINKAMGISILATQKLMESFAKQKGSVECYEITQCDFSSKWNIVKHFLKGKFVSCFNLAAKWAPDALETAEAALTNNDTEFPQDLVNCTTEVTKKMSATDEEMVMVAGFAGGMGLQGNGCGALSAAIWLITLKLTKNGNYKYTLDDPVNGEILKRFFAATDYELKCQDICDRKFNSLDEHSDFIKNGGCENLINMLSNSIN